MAKAKQGYTATVGLTLVDGTRCEQGDPVPAAAVKKSPWLLDHGYVLADEPVDGDEGEAS